MLAVVSSEVVRRGDCRLCIDHIAALAGVARSTVKNAIRLARTLGLVTVEERQQTSWRYLSNVVRIVSKGVAGLEPARAPPLASGGGVKSVTSTNTAGLELWGKRPAALSKAGCRKEADGSGQQREARPAWVADRAKAMP
ncbi:hypothetical protein [Methylobacterium nigriterrae]|uniref:hypothetical protein n=1 Tax=Methylobacterium nigriterrae TaxID=3127512 RepID=UPI00301346F7